MGGNMESTSDGTPSDVQSVELQVGGIAGWLLANPAVIEAWVAADADWVKITSSSPAGKQELKLDGGTWFLVRTDAVGDFAGLAALIRRSEQERLEHEGAK